MQPSGPRGSRTVPCVGAIVRDGRGRLLLVRRAHDPGAGQWSVPGGRVEPGESPLAAVSREVAEETGLLVVPDGLAGVVERDFGDLTYVIEDFYAALEPGCDPATARPGDDAAEVDWFFDEELDDLDCVEGLLDALRRWRVVPPRHS